MRTILQAAFCIVWYIWFWKEPMLVTLISYWKWRETGVRTLRHWTTLYLARGKEKNHKKARHADNSCMLKGTKLVAPHGSVVGLDTSVIGVTRVRPPQARTSFRDDQYGPHDRACISVPIVDMQSTRGILSGWTCSCVCVCECEWVACPTHSVRGVAGVKWVEHQLVSV
ncbi:hypothetical protein J6590_046066 [Homalodisca vitripennis]|nr:hypothetical protein J6590_046066 [Homalodisca vitripennis]